MLNSIHKKEWSGKNGEKDVKMLHKLMRNDLYEEATNYLRKK